MDGTPRVCLRKPHPNRMSHYWLHPGLYRALEPLTGSDALAQLLDCPSNWREQYEKVKNTRTIQTLRSRWVSLDKNTPESDVRSRWSGLVDKVAYQLDQVGTAFRKKQFFIGGILAEEKYDFRGVADMAYRCLGSASYALSAEVKTTKSLDGTTIWYDGRRGVQTLSCLMAFDAPTFLVTPKCWKMFVLNKERNQILTYPFGKDDKLCSHHSSFQFAYMHPRLLEMIVLCILSRPEQQIRPIIPVPGSPNYSKMNEPQLSQWTEKECDIGFSSFNDSTDNTNPIKNGPSFLSGYENGKPVYHRTVRVYQPRTSLLWMN